MSSLPIRSYFPTFIDKLLVTHKPTKQGLQDQSPFNLNKHGHIKTNRVSLKPMPTVNLKKGKKITAC